jgi:hypothetical protein
MKRLILLDLDHTLIYGSYAPTEDAIKLFQYNQYLAVYERPFARELIKLCQSNADIIIYTTALKTYAVKISKSLDIKPIQILSRKNCSKIKEKYQKQVDPNWIQTYETIIIVDDSPNVWINTNENIVFLIPYEFRGSAKDVGLEKIITEVLSYLITT